MINCILLDDQASSLDLLRSFVDKTEDIRVMQATSDPFLVLSYLETHTDVDLIFLDVEMPQLTGFDFLEMLEEKSIGSLPLVILTTGNASYAVEGYQYDRIVGFLHKLITYRKFIEMVHKVRRMLTRFQSTPLSSPSDLQDSFFVKVCYNRKEKYVRLRYNDLLYVQSQKNYVSLVTSSATYTVRRPLQEFSTLLPAADFVRTHKSYIVNLRHVAHIDSIGIELPGKHLIPISATYREEIMARIANTVIEDHY